MTRTTFALTAITLAASTAFAGAGQEHDEAGLTSFAFAGGTLPEYLAAVDTAFPETSIVVFPGGLEKIQVPAMKVNTWGPAGLIELIENTSVQGGSQSSGRGGNTGGPYWEISPIVTQLDEGLYSVRPSISGSPFAAASTKVPSNSVEVYSGPRNVEMSEVLDAISAGLEMAVGEDGATVRYHEPTRLIFIETTSAGQTVVSDIIDELHGFVPVGGFGGKESSKAIMPARYSDEDYMKVIDRLEKEVAELKKQLNSDGE